MANTICNLNLNNCDKTILFLRIYLIINIIMITSSFSFSPYKKNHDDHNEYNEGLQHSLTLEISFSCGMFIAIPMLLELVLDHFFLKYQLELIYFERVAFACSLIAGTLPMLISYDHDRSGQLHIVSQFIRNCLVLYTCLGGLYRINPKTTIWTSKIVCFIFVMCSTAFSVATG